MFLETLKSATKPFHDELEKHKLNQILFQENTTFDDYVLFLDLQYCIWNEIELKIKNYKNELKELNIEFVSRAEDAKKELLSLNLTPSLIQFDTQNISNFTTVLGCLYLLEGSRHGGMVILKKIKELAPEQHTFFFLEINRATFGNRWQTILDALIETSKTNKESETKLIQTISELYILIGRFYDEYSTINKL